jgi:hypothetical protein
LQPTAGSERCLSCTDAAKISGDAMSGWPGFLIPAFAPPDDHTSVHFVSGRGCRSPGLMCWSPCNQACWTGRNSRKVARRPANDEDQVREGAGAAGSLYSADFPCAAERVFVQ